MVLEKDEGDGEIGQEKGTERGEEQTHTGVEAAQEICCELYTCLKKLSKTH